LLNFIKEKEVAMKKKHYFGIVVVVLLFASCSIFGQAWDYWFDFPYGDEIEIEYDAWYWVRWNTSWIEDDHNDWRTPEQTFNNKGGDCEDRALLMMYLCYQFVNETPTLLVIEQPGRSRHAVVEVDGLVWDVGAPWWVPINDLEYRILNSYTYGEAMYIALNDTRLTIHAEEESYIIEED